MNTTTALLALLATACLPALAATPIDETRPLDPRGRLEVSNVKGSIEVRAWDRPEVRISGSLGDGVERLEIDGSSGKLTVKVRYPRNSRSTEPTTLVLDVPQRASVDVEGVAARIDVSGLAGDRIEVESVSGDVTVVGAPRKADISSVSGQQSLNLNSREVEAESVSGNVRLRGRIDGAVDIETVSGNIEVDTRGERARRFEAASVSGDIRYTGGLADGGRIEVESVSGDILLRLPASLSARVAAESFSGSLSAPAAAIQKPKYGPGSSFEHRYGSGAGDIRIESFSGDLKLQLD